MFQNLGGHPVSVFLVISEITFLIAGNDGARLQDPIANPGKHQSVICVGGCTDAGRRWEYSPDGKELAVLSPAVNVSSTYSRYAAAGQLCKSIGVPHAPPPSWAFKFFQVHAVFGRIWQNHAPLEDSRPLLGEILDLPL